MLRVSLLPLLAGLGLLALTARSDDAHAAWPPSPEDDPRDVANWPNDPAYASLWSHWSWLPDQTSGSPPYLGADRQLGASGMHVDEAWALARAEVVKGPPPVTIAVVGSGIVWSEPDILHKIILNPGELNGDKQARNPHGEPCPEGDCDGDGVVTVADYQGDYRLTQMIHEDCFVGGDPTKRQAYRMQADANRNCVLDPGDLIELYSDDNDDDGNGYRDDIAGWDFFKNDNNPYDDTLSRQGTTQALLSAAEASNGVGGVGTCPSCMVVPLRVGDGSVVEANDFAKAVVYATDNGASVVQAPLTLVNMTPFAVSAVDHAYKQSVTVVVGMGAESSRHHEPLTVINHTLPVNGLVHDGPDEHSSSTFLALDTCSNYGGQLALSVSGGGCDGEAVGLTAGIAGLLYAVGRSQALGLTAEEVMQVLKSTADDVDVPESRAADSKFYESKTGFDQRFGYGRIHAARAVAQVQAQLIPPEVEISSPSWFDVLDAGKKSVQIVGRVATSRAATYDVRVDWAPGVEPKESDFQVLMSKSNLSTANPFGGTNAPFPSFDPGLVDVTHPTDPDSPLHENDRTVTVRLRAVVTYDGVPVTGESRRTFAVINDHGAATDLVDGFPKKLGGSIEGGPKLADIDGDGVRDVVVASSDGAVHVLTFRNRQAVEAPGFPFTTLAPDGLDPYPLTPGVPSYLTAGAYKDGSVSPYLAREAILASPAVGDLDGDGSPEIVVTTWAGTIYVIDAAGQTVVGWPKRLPLVPSCPTNPSKQRPAVCMDAEHAWARGAYASPVLVDLDGDGTLEIVQAAFDGRMYAFRASGEPAAGWPVLVHAEAATTYARVVSTPSVADFNGDGIPDIATGSDERWGSAARAPVFLIDGRGALAPDGPYLPNWPWALRSDPHLPIVGEGIAASPASADFDGDGLPDLLVQGNGAAPMVVRFEPGVALESGSPPLRLPAIQRPDGTVQRGFDTSFGVLSTANPADAMLPLFGEPSVGDLDQDGVPDVVAAGGSTDAAESLAGGAQKKTFQALLGAWSGATGRMFAGTPVAIEDLPLFSGQAIADVTGDDYPEALVGTGGYFVHAVDACGREVSAAGNRWPKFTNGWVTSTPAVGDVDGDRQLEVVAGTREGYLYAWHTPGTDDGVVQWESSHHDNQNTGSSSTQLGQGVMRRAKSVIDCGVAESVPTRYEPGGCDCTTSRLPTTRTGWLLGFAGAIALLARRLARRGNKR